LKRLKTQVALTQLKLAQKSRKRAGRMPWSSKRSHAQGDWVPAGAAVVTILP